MSLALAFWLLVAPPDGPDPLTFVVRGGYETHEACEAARVQQVNGHQMVCVRAR